MSKDELDELVGLVSMAQKRGDSFDEGIRVALQAMLMSPNFLFRVERDSGAAPTSPTIDLASRLSFFLWSSMPDDELMRAADAGTLEKPPVFEAQVRRMLVRSQVRRAD